MKKREPKWQQVTMELSGKRTKVLVDGKKAKLVVTGDPNGRWQEVKLYQKADGSFEIIFS